MEGIGGASGKTSVRCGSLKRASQSSWNLIFQSGSLKSMAVEAPLLRVLTSAKTRALLATLVVGKRKRELKWESREHVRVG